MNDQPNREVVLFSAALELPASQRAAYLDTACADDPALRLRLEALLRVHEEAIPFLENNPPGAQESPTGAEAPGATMRLSSSPAEKAGDRIGRYKLLQQIGEGGCGVVYMAEQEEPVRRRVALKVIKLGMDTKQVIARFEAERQALALMDHPNIAKVLDAGATEAGRPYFVMELVRGIKITDYCDQSNLSTQDRLKLFMQVCQAIQHAHQKGIIHRDIKPSNMLVADHDGVPVPKIIDFGIAKATTDQRLTDRTLFTAFEQFIGTPAYMSPEQAKLSGLDIDTRTDIYSLGVLLYELLTGKTPFDAKRLMEAGLDEVRRIIREEEPLKPSTRLTQELVAADAARMRNAERGTRNAESADAERRTQDSALPIPNSALTPASSRRLLQIKGVIHLVRGDLDWIVMKALEKDRSRRYETANGLAMDIQRHLENEPVVARPPSKFYRFQKTVRRNKLAFAAAAAIATALILGVAVSGWQAVRATRAERDQSRLRTDAEAAKATAQTEARRAEAAAADVKMTLSGADFFQAVRLIAEDNAKDALPFLARSLSANPTNDAALTRLATLLTYQSWMVPGLILNQTGAVRSVQFSADGKRILTVAGLEARVWDAQTGRPVSETIKHRLPIESAQFSPDGKRIVTASMDKTAGVWDAQTGQSLTEPMTHSNGVESAAFSFDGMRILTTSFDTAARVWDAQTGEPLTEPMAHYDIKGRSTNSARRSRAVSSPKSGNVYSLNVVGYANTEDGRTETFNFMPVRAQFSPDAKQILTAADKTVVVWDTQTGQPLTEPLKHSAKVSSAQFSPDAKRIATVSDDMTVRVWDAQTGQALTEPMKHAGPAQFSPDGQRIVTVSADNTARVWDAQTGLPLTEPMNHGSSVYSARFSPDGERIVTASLDSLDRVWDAQTGQPLTDGMNRGHHLSQAGFSPDGKRVVTISGGRTVQFWDAQAGRALSETMKKGSSAQFSLDGKRILAASSSGTARMWDAQTGQPLREPTKHGTNVNSAKLSPDGSRIVTVYFDKTANVFGQTARVWDAQTGELLTETMKDGHDVRSAQFSPDNRRIVTVSEEKAARVWDAETGQEVTKPMKHELVRSAQFSPDGKRIVTASGDATARVWDAQTGELLARTMKGGHNMWSAQFSPDGKRIVTGSDPAARVWDAQTGQPLTEPMQHGSAVYSAVFSPDGKRIVTASSDNTARVWDAQTGQLLTEPLRHSDRVLSAEFSPDGKRIVTASSDMTARVWDAQTGQPLAEPIKHSASVRSAQFSPDGKRILTGSGDGIARVWDLAPTEARSPDWLPQLSEAISGKVLNKLGVLEPTRLNRFETLNQLRQKLNQQTGDDDWIVWGRWLLADRATRTISPFSKITVPEYIEHRIKEKTPASLAEAEQLAVGNPELLQRISEARETYSAWELAATLEHEKASAAAPKFHAAMAPYEKLASDSDRHKECWSFAISYEVIGGLLKEIGLTQEAEKAYQDTQVLWRKLVAHFNTEDHRFHLAVNYDELGNVLKEAGRATESLAAYRDAQATWLKLVADFSREDFRFNVGRADDDIGQLLKEAGQFEEAAEAYRQALAVWMKLVAEFNKDAHRKRLSATLASLATTLQTAGQRTDAKSLYPEAAERWEAPELNAFAWFLATGHDPKLRDGTNAVVFAEKAVAATNRKDLNYLDTLAAAYAEAGQFAKAIRTAKEALALPNTDGTEPGLTARLELYESNSPYREAH